MITRKLLLIGNPGVAGENYTPAVQLVLTRYKEYFKSEVGGGWIEDDNDALSEIIEEPAGLDRHGEVTWLALKLKELNRDVNYSIIVFVGHGGAYLGNDQVQLSQGEILPLNCLLAPIGMERVIKRTVIVDACRSLIGVTQPQLIVEGRTFSGEGELMKNYCREHYNEIIENHCEPHVELLQSTQYGEVARINPDHTGTAFSDSLFDVLTASVPRWNQQALNDRCGQLNKGIEDVLPDVQAGMVDYNQVPQYTRYGDGGGIFPLYAVWRAVDRTI